MNSRICSVCCGTKREIEIDCPSDCVHLRAGSAWEAGRQPSARPPQGKGFSEQFFHRNGSVISALAQSIVEEHQASPAMVDADVRAAFEALRATLQTLDAGLYYESQPEGPHSRGLYRRMKAVLDPLMAPSPDGQALRVQEAREVLEFLLSTHDAHAIGRPRSRRYLDWLDSVAPSARPETDPTRLIVP